MLEKRQLLFLLPIKRAIRSESMPPLKKQSSDLMSREKKLAALLGESVAQLPSEPGAAFMRDTNGKVWLMFI